MARGRDIVVVISRESSLTDFGLLIAYVLPGFTALWGASYLSPSLRAWIGSPPADAPTIGGFLFVTVASIAVGLTVSTIRWLLLDTLHHWTGVRRPALNFAVLHERVAAFDVLIAIHYRYYQFYGGSLVSLVFVYLTRRVTLGFWSMPLTWVDAGCLGLALVFFLGSRDTLKKYEERTAQLLAKRRSL